MKRIIISFLFAFGVITTFSGFTSFAYQIEPLERIVIFSDENLEIYSMSELSGLIEEYTQQAYKAHLLAETARELGWEETSQTIQMAKIEYWNANQAIKVYQKQYDKLIAAWASKSAEYPVATEIWLYMKDLGWNDYVCAGVLGNMMAEVGGHTLDIDPTLNGKYYYGICQWSRKYYSDVVDAELARQLDFLAETIQEELDTYGYLYFKGSDYNSFLDLTDEKQAAKFFAVSYERCSSASYRARQNNATTAYNYFVE